MLGQSDRECLSSLICHRDLVEMDNEMKESVKSLDLEMQNLVYTNYNKVG